MVRDMATALASDGKKVKVCVQGAMGAGVFQVRRLTQRCSDTAHVMNGNAPQDIHPALSHPQYAPPSAVDREPLKRLQLVSRTFHCVGYFSIIHAGAAAVAVWREAHHDKHGLG